MNHRGPGLRLRGVFAVLIAVAGAMGSSRCAPKKDDAPPVATPSVVLRPAEPVAGEPVEIAFSFLVAPDAPPFREDYRVFVHFLDGGGRLMWTYDHQPPIPTSQWKPGNRIDYTRTTFIAAVASPRAMTMQVGLFSPRTGERVPLSGPGEGDRSYTVASFTPRRADHQVFLTYTDGWHGAESAGRNSLEEWRWSSKTGTFVFRNPQRDVTLFLEADQPSTALPSQQVEVRLGTMVIDTFTITPGSRELRRIDIGAEALGHERRCEVTLAVDRTFVPAAVPGLHSSDARELGIRLFHAFVQARN